MTHSAHSLTCGIIMSNLNNYDETGIVWPEADYLAY